MKGEWLDKLLAFLRVMRCPFQYGKIEIDIEEGKPQRYRVMESGRI